MSSSAVNAVSRASHGDALLQVRGLTRRFASRNRIFTRRSEQFAALDSVSFDVREGEIFGLVGESGSGKSTLARCILRLQRADAGSVKFLGRELMGLSQREMRRVRPDLQIVFQDPASALSPRRTIAQSLVEPREPLDRKSRSSRALSAGEALKRVGLGAELLDRYPAELSSGQQQRVALARALVSQPRLIVADEAVSALDVSVQAQILDLIRRLRSDLGIAFVFITHDLAVVAQLADRIAVMFAGRIVETGTTPVVFGQAAHPYTRGLIAAVPDPDPSAPFQPPAMPTLRRMADRNACPYAARCAEVMATCRERAPPGVCLDATRDHRVECHLHLPGDDSSP
ncbi:MAG: ABC transporter ATP-binding protein [Xanthomonadales bacterium]|nr:ABC transporter ATP-binding protein [Xanthomonadales bacterium]